MTITLLSLVAGFALLLGGGEALVRGAEVIALRIGISKLVVGLTIVALGTSSPELFISVNAALEGFDDIALGNVVGSNICNLTLVLGTAALVRVIDVKAQLMRLDAPIMVACCFVVILMTADGEISRLDGAILTLGIVSYVAASIWLGKRDHSALDEEYADVDFHVSQGLPLSLAFLGAGLAMLFFGSELFVNGAVDLALRLGISQAVISLTLVAIGTSLPELVTTVIASLRGKGDIAVGNAIGSSIFNLLAILGITALVEPVARGGISWVDIGVMTGIGIFLVPMLYTGMRLTRLEGLLLLVTYALYLGWLASGTH